MKKFIILMLLCVCVLNLNARVTHLKGEIWVGWHDSVENNDLIPTNIDHGILNHTALDIGNYKNLYTVYRIHSGGMFIC
uniref:Uncharacterized protein n=1 Tax=candidate division WOR-3 bacterium TaxID=2052148 RepID=A0A7C4YCJ6_UNCW3